MYALKDKSGWVEFTGRKLPALDYIAPIKPEPVEGRPETVVVDVNEFWVAPELPDEDKRAKFGLHRVLTSPVPDGKRVVSWRLEDDGGEPRKVDAYEDIPVVIPDEVSSRQFMLQLEADGLLAHVEGWIAAQKKPIQIAFAHSGSFVRTEPMMQKGFAELGYDAGRVDAFFLAASTL